MSPYLIAAEKLRAFGQGVLQRVNVPEKDATLLRKLGEDFGVPFPT